MAGATPSPLVVIVSGAGPVGLTFSLNLAMMMGEHVKIIIYEGRWFVNEDGIIRWQGEEQGKTRRDQVIVLQDHIIQQMPASIQAGLFLENNNERVWPTSRNISIREVEDRLFDLIQPFVRSGQVELIAEQLNEKSEHWSKGNFDVLVGADGSNSFVRGYCNIKTMSEGIEYACGVAYNIPANVPPSDEPLHQALNCILSVSQTRYMVSSLSSRQGYLYIRLIKSEYDVLRETLKKNPNRNQPLNLLDPQTCPQSPLWSIVRQGLDFFKINQRFVFRIAPIEINVQHASIVIRELRSENNKTMLAFLAGDAAMNVHFWTGRGMNSGMKAAIALARNIVRACTSNTAPHSIEVHTPLQFFDFLDYEGFMARLRAREQQGRSLRILDNPIAESIGKAFVDSHLDDCYNTYKSTLYEKMKEARKHFQEQSDWPHKERLVSDEELQDVCNRISYNAVAQLSLANPWPIQKMSGPEVLVETTFPPTQQQFSPKPEAHQVTLNRTPTILVRTRFLILWVVGDTIDESTQKLIDTIQTSSEFADPSSITAPTTEQLFKSSVEGLHKLHVVHTIEQAQQWIAANRENIRQQDTRFKVITALFPNKKQTAVDVLLAVRVQAPRVPILIYTNKNEETQTALQFPNVIATNMAFELYEFVGIKQDTQWSTGYPVSLMESVPTSRPRPYLLWIDSDKNDPALTEQIRRAHPSLEIQFIATFAEARTFLNTNLRDLEQREKILAICKGYYANEQKSFIDVATLFKELQLRLPVPICVYTKNQAKLLQRTPNTSRAVDVTDHPNDVLHFIQHHLNH